MLLLTSSMHTGWPQGYYRPSTMQLETQISQVCGSRRNEHPSLTPQVHKHLPLDGRLQVVCLRVG